MEDEMYKEEIDRIKCIEERLNQLEKRQKILTVKVVCLESDVKKKEWL